MSILIPIITKNIQKKVKTATKKYKWNTKKKTNNPKMIGEKKERTTKTKEKKSRKHNEIRDSKPTIAYHPKFKANHSIIIPSLH